jgi:hypothetical protein
VDQRHARGLNSALRISNALQMVLPLAVKQRVVAFFPSNYLLSQANGEAFQAGTSSRPGQGSVAI